MRITPTRRPATGRIHCGTPLSPLLFCYQAFAFAAMLGAVASGARPTEWAILFPVVAIVHHQSSNLIDSID
jgi:hypothetical protein